MPEKEKMSKVRRVSSALWTAGAGLCGVSLGSIIGYRLGNEIFGGVIGGLLIAGIMVLYLLSGESNKR